jgi:hypothetical protein
LKKASLTQRRKGTKAQRIFLQGEHGDYFFKNLHELRDLPVKNSLFLCAFALMKLKKS